jgi:protein involved in polysaccharide export with SLBB domain
MNINDKISTYSVIIIKRAIQTILLIISFVIVIACSPAVHNTPPAAVSPNVQTGPHIEPEYRINVGDELDIKFFYNPELNESVIVRPDGRISLQLVHEIIVAGMTPAELTNLLIDKYSSEIKQPEIAVIVRSFGAHRIHVGGEVNTAGIIDYIGPMTVLQSISRAGGLKDTARINEIIVIRRKANQKPQIIMIDLEKVFDGTEMGQDIVLNSYDIVYVPKSPIANLNQWVDQYIRKNIPVPVSAGWRLD